MRLSRNCRSEQAPGKMELLDSSWVGSRPRLLIFCRARNTFIRLSVRQDKSAVLLQIVFTQCSALRSCHHRLTGSDDKLALLQQF